MSTEPRPPGSHAPLTEEQIRAHTIGGLRPWSARILIVDYDPRWPKPFERAADRIRDVLGHRALRIEQAGSTAVPGLVAKPIIDMPLAVIDSADEGAYVPDMEAAGDKLGIREPDRYEQRMFKGPDTDIDLQVFS
jgi:GrpB-like predicted nucleotidyltransferase (UPF0157 family)